jgi:diketogulonate reductase-like aldo/keto reductase
VIINGDKEALAKYYEPERNALQAFSLPRSVSLGRKRRLTSNPEILEIVKNHHTQTSLTALLSWQFQSCILV